MLGLLLLMPFLREVFNLIEDLVGLKKIHLIESMKWTAEAKSPSLSLKHFEVGDVFEQLFDISV